MESAPVETAARLVSADPGKLAGERNCDADERYSFTVFDSNDASLQGGAPEITGFSANRPNLVAGQSPNSGPRTTSAWLNANAFARVVQDPNSPVLQFAAQAVISAKGRICELGFLGIQKTFE